MEMEKQYNREPSIKKWGDCNSDVLMMIFQLLDVHDLQCCMAVNEYWRDTVDYYVQHTRKWKELAQQVMANKGVTFRNKSKLTWRQLYYNSLLWRRVKEADISWRFCQCFEYIKYIYVYKDKLIIMYEAECEEMSFFRVDKQNIFALRSDCSSLSTILRKKYISLTANNVEDTLSDNNEISNEIYDESDGSERLFNKMLMTRPFKKLILMQDSSFYQMDEKNVLRRHDWNDSTKSWADFVLARYYGCKESISDIHLYDHGVYLLRKCGTIMRLNREGRNFELEEACRKSSDYYSCFVRRSEISPSIDRVLEVDLPTKTIQSLTLFQKYSVAVSVFGTYEFKIKHDPQTDHMIMECPGLSCATEHGEMLFLGYEDGKIEICNPNKMLINGGKPEISMNIQDYTTNLDTTIVGIDVYEDYQTNHIFIATKTNIMKLVITYPEYLKKELGISK